MSEIQVRCGECLLEVGRSQAMVVKNEWLCRTCKTRLAKAKTRRLPKSACLIGVLLVGLTSACHTISKEAETELSDTAAAGDNLLKKWDGLTDAQKRGLLWRTTRTCYDVLGDTRGDPIPAAYVGSTP